jgi:hypothetical protein
MADKSKFQMVGYAGSIIDGAFWGRLVIDIAGIGNAPKMPALREHFRDRPVGVVDCIDKRIGEFLAQGFYVGTRDGIECRDLIRENFPMQASLGLEIEVVEEITVKETVSVNGSLFEGPGYVVRECLCREISFVSLGADPETSVTNLSSTSMGKGKVIMENQHGQRSFMELVKEYRGKFHVPYGDAIVAVRKDHEKEFRAYIEGVNPGKALTWGRREG